jgi:hypothetical protein
MTGYPSRESAVKCVLCEKEAQAICKFCGRAVCKGHIREQRYPSGFANKLGWWSREPNGVVVPDTVWCGSCHPEFSGTS